MKKPKGTPTDLNMYVFDRELRAGGGIIKDLPATSIESIRRILKAGYLEPAPGAQRGYWVASEAGKAALAAWRETPAGRLSRTQTSPYGQGVAMGSTRARKRKSAEDTLLADWQGLSKRRRLSSFSRVALKKGEKVEREHTGSRALARRIAADHLVEKKDYYERLKKAGLAQGEAAISLTRAELKAIESCLKDVLDNVFSDVEEQILSDKKRGRLSQSDYEHQIEKLGRDSKPFGAALAKVRRALR